MEYLEPKTLSISGCVVDPRPKSQTAPSPSSPQGIAEIAKTLFSSTHQDVIALFSEKPDRSRVQFEFEADANTHIGPYLKDKAVQCVPGTCRVEVFRSGDDLHAEVFAPIHVAPPPAFKLISTDRLSGVHPALPAAM